MYPSKERVRKGESGSWHWERDLLCPHFSPVDPLSASHFSYDVKTFSNGKLARLSPSYSLKCLGGILFFFAVDRRVDSNATEKS